MLSPRKLGSWGTGASEQLRVMELFIKKSADWTDFSLLSVIDTDY
jgi:hypothetical protein